MPIGRDRVKPPPRLVRRTIIDPLFVPFAIALAATFALIVIVTALIAPLTPRRRVLRLAALALTYLCLDVALMVAGLALWLRSPLARRRDGQRWVEVHARLLQWALRAVLRAAHRLMGFETTVDPECEVPPFDGRPIVVLARHGGPGDSFALVWLLLERWKRIPRVVLKDALTWDPGLDVVLTRMSGCFLSPGSDSQDNVRCVVEHADGLSGNDAMLLFPEGGNWTPERHRRAVRRLRRAHRWRAARLAADRTHVLPPRPAGAAATLTSRPDLDVVVVAHAGLDHLTTVRAVWNAIPVATPMRVHWWVEPAGRIPTTESGITEWLDKQWSLVEDWVADDITLRDRVEAETVTQTP